MQKNIGWQELQKQFDALSALPKEQIEFLIDRAKIVAYPQDSYLFKADEPADNMTFILGGHFKIYIHRNGNTTLISELNAGDITGLLPFSRMEKARANAIATEDSWALQFPRSAMRELIKDHYELTTSLVHEMTGRVRTFTTLQQQNERMISLGKLSAGLAHELNNPTAAIGRSARMLDENRRERQDQLKELLNLKDPARYLELVQSLLEEIESSPNQSLGILEQQDLEDEWLDFFEDHGYSESENLIEQLVEHELDQAIFENTLSTIDESDRTAVLNYLSGALNQISLQQNVATAADRISELVGSIKSFTHMDQAQDMGLADLSQSLESTLKILDHKIRKDGIQIIKEYQSDLPKVPLRVGQVNQVFTNLLDNAIDALSETKPAQIKIKTAVIRDSVQVTIEDNGPGIPDDLQALIFDPFFTTKEVGKGSGMGLEISRRIIEQHKGKLELQSAANPTIFSITLPLQA